MNKRKFLSFGFNCEVGFALEHAGVLDSSVFTWADIRGTDALIKGISRTEDILSGTVKPYSSNMLFCENSKIGFHGRFQFNNIDAKSSFLDIVNRSTIELRERIRYLENKQATIIQGGGALIVVKWFADIFQEDYTLNQSANLVRETIERKYNTDNFDLLYVTESAEKINAQDGRNFVRSVSNFSPRIKASNINWLDWKVILSEFGAFQDSTSHTYYKKEEVALNLELQKAATYWSAQRNTGRTRYWKVPAIIKHVNKLICGRPLDGYSSGLVDLLRTKLNGKTLRKGISIGCGAGLKEIKLLKEGLVDSFDLYEISQNRVDQGLEIARKEMVSDRIRFFCRDVYSEELPNESYDLVYWDSALHHMLCTKRAIKWSYDKLVTGGIFLMHDYIGASRFQWPQEQLNIASKIRKLLPDSYLKSPFVQTEMLSRCLVRPNLHELIAKDPTEAADSDNIIPAINSIFLNAEIKYLGGVIYHLALNDILANFDDFKDAPLLQSLLMIDELLANDEMNHFAVAYASKQLV